VLVSPTKGTHDRQAPFFVISRIGLSGLRRSATDRFHQQVHAAEISVKTKIAIWQRRQTTPFAFSAGLKEAPWPDLLPTRWLSDPEWKARFDTPSVTPTPLLCCLTFPALPARDGQSAITF
jgi:hypothetical protein